LRTPRKVLLDRWICLPAARGLGALARLARGLRSQDRHGIDDGVRCIAVAKFLGLGSLLQATPLLRSLRQRLPGARIVLLTTRGNRDFAERLGPLDEILTIDDSGLRALASSVLRALVALRRLRVDVYIDLEVYSAFARLLSWMSGARRRAGFEGGAAPAIRGIATHAVPYDPGTPLREMYLAVGVAAGVPPVAERHPGPVRVDETDRRGVRKRLGDWWREGTPYLVVNPNASDLLLERRWPADRVAALLERLAARGHRVAMIGAPSEAAYVETVLGLVRPETRSTTINTAGRVSLSELLALIDGAACAVSNDSGPMHMAVALRRPTVALFGPCDPAQFGIQGDFVEVLYRRVACSPCVHAGPPRCRGDNVCMKLITVDDVLAAVDRVMTAAPGLPDGQWLRHFGLPDEEPLGFAQVQGGR
jgi:ADP-heptose:LPS heptosyltransferase